MAADEDQGPDYRTVLAAERTYLAYVRTSLTLLAAGVAVVGVFPDAGYTGLRRVAGVVLVAIGILVGATSRGRWRAIDRAVADGRPIPPSRIDLPTVLGLVAAGTLALILVLVV
jgi:inner membrane protein YidH